MLNLFASWMLLLLPVPISSAPSAVDPGVVWSHVSSEGVVSMLFDDGSAATMLVDVEGTVTVSAANAAIAHALPQGPTTGGPIPTLTTAYKDEDGMTHTITTPIPSTTPAGLESALRVHRDLVRLMKGIYPPAPHPG
jgi:hypothetical protein